MKSRLKFSIVWTSCCRLRKVIHIRCCLIKSGSTLEHAFTIEHTFPLSWLDTASIQLFLKTLQPIYNLNCINLYRIRYRKFCVNKMIRLTNASSPSNHGILKYIYNLEIKNKMSSAVEINPNKPILPQFNCPWGPMGISDEKTLTCFDFDRKDCFLSGESFGNPLRSTAYPYQSHYI